MGAPDPQLGGVDEVADQGLVIEGIGCIEAAQANPAQGMIFDDHQGIQPERNSGAPTGSHGVQGGIDRQGGTYLLPEGRGAG